MNNQKPIEFQGGAFDYFMLTIISVVLAYIPLVGWAILLNYASGWFADKTLVTGKKIKFKAEFGESFVFVLVNFFLFVITFGIYTFWLVPKAYRYVLDHTNFVDESPVVGGPIPAPTVPESTEAPAPPVATDGATNQTDPTNTETTPQV